MKRVFFLLIALATVIAFTGCAHPAPEVEQCVANVHAHYGFWWGLWNGMTLPFSFIGSLFNDNIVIYALNNTGHWYDFGFWLGVGGLGSGVATSSRRR